MRVMKAWILAAPVACALAVGAPAMAADETRTVPAFSAVDFSGFGKMEITAGETQSVTLIGSAKTLGRVMTDVHDDTLVVKWDQHKERHGWLWRFVMPDEEDKDKLTVKISVPKLHKIGVSGASSVVAKGIDSEVMTVTLSGASKIRADGRADKLALSISGAGEANLDRLVVKDASVSISGVGHAYVYPKDNLTADISGVGAVRYKGEPHVTSTISGAGSVKGK